MIAWYIVNLDVSTGGNTRLVAARDAQHCHPIVCVATVYQWQYNAPPSRLAAIPSPGPEVTKRPPTRPSGGGYADLILAGWRKYMADERPPSRRESRALEVPAAGQTNGLHVYDARSR